MLTFDTVPQIKNANYFVTIPWSELEGQLQFYGRAGINLDPNYQRGYVWTEYQQQRYVEWILRGGLTGRDILWNNPSFQRNYDQPLEIVDGKQRLQAAQLFLADKLEVFGGYKHSDLLGEQRSLSWDVCFTFYINNLQNRKDVIQWYLDFNSGGSIHTEDEIERVKKLLEEA